MSFSLIPSLSIEILPKKLMPELLNEPETSHDIPLEELLVSMDSERTDAESSIILPD